MRVVRALSDHLEIVGLTGKNNTASLLKIAGEFPFAALCSGDKASADVLQQPFRAYDHHGKWGWIC